MQAKKAIFLFLALLLPVAIFVFLKAFGKNEFDVPALYQDVAPVASADCQGNYAAPYHVADSVMAKLSQPKSNELYVIHYGEAISSRIAQEVKYEEVSFVNAQVVDGDGRAKRCVFVVPGEEDMVVVDKQGKIRGHYTSTNREDVDRFLLELEILLKKY